MDVNEYRALLAKSTKKTRKYRNTPVGEGADRFDSTGERDRWHELLILQRTGRISELQKQVTFELFPSVKYEGDKRATPAMRYVADFVYMQGGKKVVEDFKSDATMTRVFKIKRHAMKAILGIEIKLKKAGHA